MYLMCLEYFHSFADYYISENAYKIVTQCSETH
jgi:hypothetical protein